MKKVPSHIQEAALQSAIYHLIDKDSFIGFLLQEITLKYTEMLPTLGITYDSKSGKYILFINPDYFCLRLNSAQRIAALKHEILHFTNQHMFRLPKSGAEPEDDQIRNISADMAINQVIQDCPEGCNLCSHVDYHDIEDFKKLHPTEEDKLACPGKWVDVKTWKMDDGSQFPVLKSMEDYYDLVLKERKKQEQSPEDRKKDGLPSKTKGNVPEQIKKFIPGDDHEWGNLDEETKQRMIDEAKQILKRTVEKSSYSHSTVPDSIKDLLDELESLARGMNHKQILRSTIKKTVSAVDRESTWNKPSKRFGVYAPGTRVGNMPQLNTYVDFSGSISVTEANMFLGIIDNFLKAGTRKCSLGLWHTDLFYKKPYKLGNKLNRDDFESGGTDVTCVLQDIRKTNPNLAIILTDGYFNLPNIKVNSEVLWIISNGGNQNITWDKKHRVIYLDKISK